MLKDPNPVLYTTPHVAGSEPCTVQYLHNTPHVAGSSGADCRHCPGAERAGLLGQRPGQHQVGIEPPHPTPRELWVLFLAYNILVGPGIILG